jgi:uncharacterized membrane protein YfhO
VKILVTPDFGRSDAWDFSFATKYLLGQSLHEGAFPLWTRLLGGGFPLIGEGQIGAFFLPNLILFRLLPPVAAYNATLLLALFLAAMGMYLLLRRLTCTRLASAAGATALALSGILIPQLTHHTLIQGISLLPLILVATDMLIERFSPRRIAFFAFLVSQQILAGFPQAVFITVLFAASWAAWKKRLLRLVVPCVLALGLGAIQLLPSFEFLRQSTVRMGFSAGDATYFSFPPAHLLTFFWPFLLGNPRLGTYPPFAQFDGSLFWENTGYFGGPAFLLAVLGVVWSLKTRRLRFFVAAAGGGLLLAMGKHSPFYILFSFFPFSLFRVPSRFLWVVVPSLIVLCSMVLDSMLRHKRLLVRGIALVLIAGNLAALVVAWRGYHAVDDSARWLAPPETVSRDSGTGRIFTMGSAVAHNQTFLTAGWQQVDPYWRLRASLAPDGNIIWNVPHAGVYAGRQILRQDIMLTLLDQEEHETTRTKLLQILNVETLLTATDGGVLVTPLEPAPRAYAATDIRSAATVAQAARELTAADFRPGESVVLENRTHAAGGGSARITSEHDTEVIIEATMASEGVLVLADTYYPGWHVTVDGAPDDILPANITQRAVIVPAGVHTVVFRYRPQSLFVGAGITLACAVLTVILAAIPTPHVHARTGHTAPGRPSRPRRSPGRSRTHTAAARAR